MLKKSSNLEKLQDYIINNMIVFFAGESENITSRYVLYFDGLDNIVSFLERIRTTLTDEEIRKDIKERISTDASLEISLLPPYPIKNDEGEVEYEAVQIRINTDVIDRTIVFIPDCDDNGEVLGDAFKNSIRNKFVDEHQDAILFYLSVQNIASVSKTTENFQRQGMPLSITNVYEYLKRQIVMITNENQQKIVLYVLNKLKANKPQNDTSLLEFAPIIRIIEARKMTDEDFHDLHMFHMEFANLGKKDCFIAENYKLYKEISLALSDQELDNILSGYEEGIKKEISEEYNKNTQTWDKKFSFEYIQKNKKENKKKFKLEKEIEIIDHEGNYLNHDFYLSFVKNNVTSLVIMTRDYTKEKKFGALISFTQKANATPNSFEVETLNSRGNKFKINIDGNKFCQNGRVTFEGGKKDKYTVLISVINVHQNFFGGNCVGFGYSAKFANYYYLLTANDYSITLGGGEGKAEQNYSCRKDKISILLNSENSTEIKFGLSDEEDAKKQNVELNLDNNSALIDAEIKFEDKTQSDITVYDLFNQCMLKGNSFYIEDEKLVNKHIKSEKYITKEFDVAGKKYSLYGLIALEKELVENKYKYVETTGLKVTKELSCKVPEDIEECYDKICDYFSIKGTSPTISYINDELSCLYEEYVSKILKYIGNDSQDFIDKKKISTEILNILKLGMIEDKDGLIWLSSLSPLSIAYQLQLKKKDIDWVELDSYLYDSLGFVNALPFILDKNDVVYQAIKGGYPIQWACYCDAYQSIKGSSSTYYQKIEDYYVKFNYLFVNNSKHTFIINVIGIQHTSEIVKAIHKLFTSKRVEPRNLYLEINYYYQNTGKNDFDDMTDYNYLSFMSREWCKKTELADDFCDWYIEHVRYNSIRDCKKYKYAHVTFCALQNEKKASLSNTISESESGIMLDGLISDIPSSLDKESGIYKYGFGGQYIEELVDKSIFVRLLYHFNELAKCKEGSPACRDLCIAQGVQNTKSESLDAIYKASNWVVFVEPKIDLDFFIGQDNSNDKDLIIIHYPDKNMTSTGYTSITVTQKSNQYINVIREFLQEKLSNKSDDNVIKSIIKNFNAYSGEWLMNFINNKQIEEKVSLVSAIGFCKDYFSIIYPEYTWIPIALDEVLRVTGSIGGSLTDVLFSKKVLINRGIIESQNATSDDLLFAGIKNESGKVVVTYIPIEVKHGNCDSKTKNDAHNQVCNTADLLRSSFIDKNNDNKKRVDKKIYRNYMIQHVISNVEKMLAYKIEESNAYKEIVDSKIRVDLLNDNYTLEINNYTDAYTFYFVEGQIGIVKSKNSKDGVIELSVPLNAMYLYLVDKKQVLNDAKCLSSKSMEMDDVQYDIDIHEEESTFDENDIGDQVSEELSGELEKIKNEKNALIDNSTLIDNEKNALIDNSTPIDNEKSDVLCNSSLIDNDKNDNTEILVDSETKHIRDMRILIGDDIAGNKIYWEYGNERLANRHLLITGTSGQGKTYSIQTMLYELTQSGVSSIIFDYTEGYMKSRLEKPFIEKIGNKINEKIVYNTGVPINPFLSHEIDISGNIVKEKPALVAARLADIFSHVYDLGEQQYSAIFTAVLNGINKYGNSMSMKYFQEELALLQETNKTAQSVISRMNPFFNTISFEGDNEFDWGNVLYSDDAKVNIFQMTMLSREMQVIITELMLWDAWYYTKKFGDKNKPFVVVLDEAQNLSHKANSPSAVILTEGRKFGWSAWFATQSLKVLKDDEVVRLSQAAFRMYFKPTEDEIVKIAKLLDPTGEINWIHEVKGLQKGQCIVVGDRTNNEGVFGATRPTVVSVSSFEKR